VRAARELLGRELSAEPFFQLPGAVMGEVSKTRMKKQTKAQGNEGLPHRSETPEASSGAIPVTSMHLGRSGEWMDPAEMRQAAGKYFEWPEASTAGELALDLSGLEHLDASALQVLLAIRAEQLRRNGRLRLANASENLRKWFAWAGADDLFVGTPGGRKPAEAKESDLCAKS
jgi:anti-anti-sigma factor